MIAVKTLGFAHNSNFTQSYGMELSNYQSRDRSQYRMKKKHNNRHHCDKVLRSEVFALTGQDVVINRLCSVCGFYVAVDPAVHQ